MADAQKASDSGSSSPSPNSLTIIPIEVRIKIYTLVLGDRAIHIRSDIPPRPEEANADKQSADGDDTAASKTESIASSEEDGLGDVLVVGPEFSENDDTYTEERGPLYHSTCKTSLLSPLDSKSFRLRTLVYSHDNAERAYTTKDIALVSKADQYPGLNFETTHLCDIGVYEASKQLNLSLLRTCKMVYQEASEVLYSKNTFVFTDHITFATFFDIQPATRRTPIKSKSGADSVLTKRSAIKSLQIAAELSSFSDQLYWFEVFNSAAFVVPNLTSFELLLDLKSSDLWMARWQDWRHEHGFSTLTKVLINVSAETQVCCEPQDLTKPELHEDGWSEKMKWAIANVHMDVVLKSSTLDASREATRTAWRSTY
ncbi:hypothetical protein MMC28_006933 [Mycoblastus sanguinarius]|nr:hypothetical protein [Mycoblastus sanguinarius]